MYNLQAKVMHESLLMIIGVHVCRVYVVIMQLCIT